MTYKEFLNSTKSNQELATFLFNFCSSFYTESISGLCDRPCIESNNSCYGCIEELLDKEIDVDLLHRA